MARRITLAFPVCQSLHGGLRTEASTEACHRHSPPSCANFAIRESQTGRRAYSHALMPRLLTHSPPLPPSASIFRYAPLTASPSHNAHKGQSGRPKREHSITHWPHYRTVLPMSGRSSLMTIGRTMALIAYSAKIKRQSAPCSVGRAGGLQTERGENFPS